MGTKRLKTMQQLRSYVASVLRRVEAGIEGDTDGNGLSVADLIARRQLQTMCAPVSEIKRTRHAELEGIPAVANVLQV